MKTYIKPVIKEINIKSSQIMAASNLNIIDEPADDSQIFAPHRNNYDDEYDYSDEC